MMQDDNLENLSLFETTGFSMWPFLRAGEKLVIKKTPIKNLRVGDIILYRKNSQLVCHRLIKRIKDGEKCLLYARGDSSLSRPEPVTEEMFQGKAISVIKNGRIISLHRIKGQLINRLIVLIAPLISWTAKTIRPCYGNLKRLTK